MVEFISIGFLIMSIVFIYTYTKEKLQEITKIPFDKHIEV